MSENKSMKSYSINELIEERLRQARQNNEMGERVEGCYLGTTYSSLTSRGTDPEIAKAIAVPLCLKAIPEGAVQDIFGPYKRSIAFVKGTGAFDPETYQKAVHETALTNGVQLTVPSIDGNKKLDATFTKSNAWYSGFVHGTLNPDKIPADVKNNATALLSKLAEPCLTNTNDKVTPRYCEMGGEAHAYLNSPAVRNTSASQTVPVR